MRFKRIYLAVLLVFCTVAVNTEAQDYTTAMKVRYLKSFTKYVEWPSSYKTGDFIIGVLNNSKITDALKIKLKDKTIGVQPYKVVNFTDANAVGKCHLIYVPTDKSSHLKTVVSKVKKYSTLVVTDQPGLIEKGSSINLVMEGPKQKFELNKRNMQRCSLTISAQLEPMATKVIN